LAADGVDFLRAQLNFYNKRDFRVETSLNLLERWGAVEVVERPDNAFNYRILEEPPESFWQTLDNAARLKVQNQKLFTMVTWAQTLDQCRMTGIHRYFAHISKPCGICDNCISGNLEGKV
jgi:hypothetical protein